MTKLSKEAKIGVGILAILAVVFVVVLAGRLLGLGGDKAVATEGEVKPAATPTTASKQSAAAGKPTVLAPRNLPGQRPTVSPADVSRLSAAAEDGAAQPMAATPSPSLMPDPPQAQAADPRQRYGSAYAGSTPRTDELGGAEVAEAGASTPTADLFRGRTTQYPTAIERSAQPHNALRLPNDSAAAPSADAKRPAAAMATDGDDRGAAVGRAAVPLSGATYSRDGRLGSSAAAADLARINDDKHVAVGPASQYQTARTAPQYGSSHGDVSSGVETRPASSSTHYAARDGRRDDGTYEVQPNENYWVISEKLYGTGAYFKALAEHNRRKSARDERLQVGDVIATPELAQLEKNYPDLCPKPSRREAAKKQMTTVSARQTGGGRTYLTQEGDTLYDIARSELGKASRWAEIYDLNRDLLGSDYHYLRPGLQLALPEGETVEQPGKLTRRTEPEGTFRR